MKNSSTNKTSIICFGEILWDMLPNQKVAGGAPMNVVFHASNLGVSAELISAVGNDELGNELRFFLQEKAIATDLLHTNYSFPTSTVQVHLDAKGSASYEIVMPVAWDFLFVDEKRIDAVSSAEILVFGSLICRNEHNVKTLLALIDKAQKTVFDVNLRPPFYTPDLIEQLLHKADVVKLNDEELAIILQWYQKTGDLKEQMIFLMEKFELETLIITEGKHGAYCMHKNDFFEQQGFPIQVKDTIGSGDSFLAAFLSRMLKGFDWQQSLEFACATGALVAMHAGGTPTIDEAMVLDFIKKQKHKN